MKHPLNGSSLSRKILMALAALLVIVYFYPHPEANRFIYQEGRPWNYSKLIAPFDIPIHADSATILAARDTLEKRFVPIYSVNPKATTATCGGGWPTSSGKCTPPVWWTCAPKTSWPKAGCPG